jgi:ornithine carbamoyltransferase
MIPNWTDLSRIQAADLRGLRARCRAVRRGEVRPLDLTAPIALLCASPTPYVRAAVEAGAALVGLRVATYGPEDVAALGDLGVAGQLLGATASAIVTVGLGGRTAALAERAPCPVINAGDSDGDAVGALADLVVIEQGLGSLEGRRLAWVGDSCGLTYDLLLAACTAGMSVAVAHPTGYAPDADRLTAARERAAMSGAAVMVTTDLAEALLDSDAVYVEPWPEGAGDRFRAYTVHRHTLRHARAGALLLHRAPERRGPELATSLVEDGAWMAATQARARADAVAALLTQALRPDPLRGRMA